MNAAVLFNVLHFNPLVGNLLLVCCFILACAYTYTCMRESVRCFLYCTSVAIILSLSWDKALLCLTVFLPWWLLLLLFSLFFRTVVHRFIRDSIIHLGPSRIYLQLFMNHCWLFSDRVLGSCNVWTLGWVPNSQAMQGGRPIGHQSDIFMGQLP